MASGVDGDPVASALGPVEEELNISPGGVTLLLQQTGETIARGNLLGTVRATRNNVS